MHFIVAALGKDLDEFTLHIWASVAEQERQLISDRNKAARAVMKARGIKMGMARYSQARQRQISALANAGKRRAARERAEAYRPHIEWALRQPASEAGRFHLIVRHRHLTDGKFRRHWADDGVASS